MLNANRSHASIPAETGVPTLAPALDTVAEIQFSAVQGGTVFRVTYSSRQSALDNRDRIVARGCTIVYTRGL